ncbi:hypothetical protein [Streptomyces sp. NPDC051561]|uniref:hypothetical protein n=1 Tax=Streptomyces sp. NPDC051561 TaxID=3365658 RepID=UPI0037A34A79
MTNTARHDYHAEEKALSVSQQQLDAFARAHESTIHFDVQPRHLAGEGNHRHVVHALMAAGWKIHSDPAALGLDLRDPSWEWRLQLSPTLDLRRWRISNPQGFEAIFSRLAPVEIIAGLTDALAASPPAEAPPSAWHIFTAAGWSCTTDANGHGHAISPDQLVRVDHGPANPGFDEVLRWDIQAHAPQFDLFLGEYGQYTDQPGPVFWSAELYGTPPPHLLAGFASALASTEPLLRGGLGTTRHNSTQMEPSRLSGRHVVREHAERLKAFAAQARAALRATPPPPVPAPVARRR